MMTSKGDLVDLFLHTYDGYESKSWDLNWRDVIDHHSSFMFLVLPSAKYVYSTASSTALQVYQRYINAFPATIPSLKERSPPVLHCTTHTSIERQSYYRNR